MKTRIILTVAAALALFANIGLAADVNGKWVAETTTQNGDKRTQTFDLKADGSKLTGTITSQMGEQKISDGKVDGDNVSFSVTMERNGNTMTMNYTGKVVGDELKLKRETPRGTQEITAKRSTT